MRVECERTPSQL